jgi:hypothetical protein
MKKLTIEMKDSIYAKIVKWLEEEFNDIPAGDVKLGDVKFFIDEAIADKLDIDALEVFMNKESD